MKRGSSSSTISHTDPVGRLTISIGSAVDTTSTIVWTPSAVVKSPVQVISTPKVTLEKASCWPSGRPAMVFSMRSGAERRRFSNDAVAGLSASSVTTTEVGVNASQSGPASSSVIVHSEPSGRNGSEVYGIPPAAPVPTSVSTLATRSNVVRSPAGLTQSKLKVKLPVGSIG